MAGDWIKIRTDLVRDPQVMRLSDILGTDDPTTVGLLVIFWAWADGQTTDGANLAISSARLDRLIGRQGFVEGMRQIGWLSGRDGSLCLPRYDRHNSSSAKARALESEAKRLRRQMEQAERQAAASQMSDNQSDKSPTPVGPNVRPEKRREEKKLSSGERERAAAPPVEPSPDRIIEPDPEERQRALSLFDGADAANPSGDDLATEDDALEMLARAVGSLRSAWQHPLTVTERKALIACRRTLESFTERDWKLMRDYLAADPRHGVKEWKVTSKQKFLEAPADLLGYAEDWTSAQRPAQNRHRVRAGIPEDFVAWLRDSGYRMHPNVAWDTPTIREEFQAHTRASAARPS